MFDEAAMRALAKHFFDCVEKGDVDGLVACYAPDAEIWHNTDGLVQGPEDNRKGLQGMTKRISDRVYDERRVYVYPEGFTHQHVLRGTRTHDGARLALDACIVCRVKDGKITRLDEYFDSAQVAEFRKFA
ncbi:nuclear transport factor 2 family protein [Phenylobacterium sp. J367]|uniref:nuclear transport factor 2 family protein n=1 Tax=Phenylobacterium sp. J367 TaxID=2898435 RepID=UPI002151C872|nr:nuclear transport factor 2 family protein [Phenylobacterium sp. J367]MCR5881154.1 nuclear transport factor 2 family protein [Phenylobacterium sp. J367]